jgi:hypothetical protein
MALLVSNAERQGRARVGTPCERSERGHPSLSLPVRPRTELPELRANPHSLNEISRDGPVPPGFPNRFTISSIAILPLW